MSENIKLLHDDAWAAINSLAVAQQIPLVMYVARVSPEFCSSDGFRVWAVGVAKRHPKLDKEPKFGEIMKKYFPDGSDLFTSNG